VKPKTNPKFSEKYSNIHSFKLFGWLLFVLVQSKHQNPLFRYRSETTETNCSETNWKKPKKTKKKTEKPKFSVKNSIFSSLWNMEELRQKS
jgi:hypothetical protein